LKSANVPRYILLELKISFCKIFYEFSSSIQSLWTR